MLRVAPWYFRSIIGTSLLVSLLVYTRLGLKSYAAAALIPALILSFLATAILFRMFVPLPLAPVPLKSGKLEPWRRDLRLFIGTWIVLTLYIVVYATAIGWSEFLLGARRSEAFEVGEMFSMPLGLLNSDFLIGPETAAPAVVGIVFANAFFWTVAILGVWKFVHSRLRRTGDVIQLGVNNSVKDEDD